MSLVEGVPLPGWSTVSSVFGLRGKEVSNLVMESYIRVVDIYVGAKSLYRIIACLIQRKYIHFTAKGEYKIDGKFQNSN